jgi:hypothetical protein
MGDLSELIFYANHPEEREDFKYDVSFLLSLVPEEWEWILGLMKTEEN